MYKECMGQEILYCSSCQNQLRSAEFEKGKAFRVGAEAICAKCAPEALKTLPSEKRDALQKSMMGEPPPTTPKGGTPKSGTGRVPIVASTPRSGTGRIPLANAPPSTRRGAASSKSAAPLVIG